MIPTHILRGLRTSSVNQPGELQEVGVVLDADAEHLKRQTDRAEFPPRSQGQQTHLKLARILHGNRLPKVQENYLLPRLPAFMQKLTIEYRVRNFSVYISKLFVSAYNCTQNCGTHVAQCATSPFP